FMIKKVTSEQKTKTKATKVAVKPKKTSTPEKQEKTVKPKPSKASKVTKVAGKKLEGVDLTQELVEGLVERGRRSGMLSYEEVMDFCDRNHVGEQEVNDLLKILEKENIELVMQEELEADAS